MIRTQAAFVAMLLLASAAHAGDQGDPEQTCDGSTYQIVECLKTKTAEWDKRMNIAYQQAMKDAKPAQRDQLRAAQRLWILVPRFRSSKTFAEPPVRTSETKGALANVNL